MRLLLLFLALALPAGCKRTSGEGQSPAAAAPGSPAAGRLATLKNKGPVPRVPDVAGVAADAPRPVVGSASKVDCNKLLGADGATRILGMPLSAAAPDKLGTDQCRWTSADGVGQVEVRVTCREGAVKLYRQVDRNLAEGHQAIGVGHKSVLIEDKGRATIQIIDEKSPCGVEMTVQPAAKGAEVARAVFSGLHPALGR